MRRWAACSVKATPPYRRIPAPAFGSAWTAAPCTPAAILPLTRHGCPDIKSIEIKILQRAPHKRRPCSAKERERLCVSAAGKAQGSAAARREGKGEGRYI